MTDSPILYDNPQTYAPRHLTADERASRNPVRCRLWHADGDTDALHAFAERLGVERSSFRPEAVDAFGALTPAHYLVTEYVAGQAKAAGAERTTLRAWLLDAKAVTA